MRELNVFSIFLPLRLASVFFVQTYYVPDEYWQVLEVAHKIAFGYGYLTWEWSAGIRSYFYPLVVAGLYNCLKWAQLDHPLCLIYGPRIMQAVLSAYADLCFYRWSRGEKWAAYSIATSWFWFYTASRTLINTLETALTIIALSQFPWSRRAKDESTKFLWIVALACAVRPTAFIIFWPLSLYQFGTTKVGAFSLIIKRYIPVGLVALTLSILIDSWGHGSFLMSQFEFFRFNLYRGIGTYYGTHPWYWYITDGVPLTLGINLFPFIIAIPMITDFRNRRRFEKELLLLGIVLFSIGSISFIPHKEMRFLLPLLPLILHIMSRFLSIWSRNANTYFVWLVAIMLFVANAIPIYYLSMIHQRGTLDVMEPLREISAKDPENTNLLFLMPCHSTPYYSHLHVNVTMKFLTCHPNFYNYRNYMDEADQFYEDPSTWLRRRYPLNDTLPTHIICFDKLAPAISDILSMYKTTHTIFHTEKPLSARIGKYILINERVL